MQKKEEEIEEKFDEKEAVEMKEVKCLTTKELKALAKPEFSKNPENFYPVKIFEKIGFSRH